MAAYSYIQLLLTCYCSSYLHYIPLGKNIVLMTFFIDSSSINNSNPADVEGTVPISFFTAGTDLKASNKRSPHNRLKLFKGLENHETCPFLTAGVSPLWHGSSRSHLEAIDSGIPEDSAPDADLVQDSDGLSNLDDIDEFVSASAEDNMSAANTPPRFSSPCVNDMPTKTKGAAAAAFDLF